MKIVAKNGTDFRPKDGDFSTTTLIELTPGGNLARIPSNVVFLVDASSSMGGAKWTMVKQAMGADPASVAFDTVNSALAQKSDVVIIDTAGRLHNKTNLMNELSKIRRVIQKVIPDAPHENLLVLDASTGQNAIEQARQFTKATEVNALALTKLDGTARGGVVIGIADEFRSPVQYIGVGEKAEDLQAFDREEFVDSLFHS